MAEAVVSIVVERLGDLLIEEAEALHGISDRVEEIQAKLTSLQGFLKEVESRQKEQRFRDWVADVRELAYDASDLLESFVLEVGKSKRKGGGGGGIKTILKRYVYILNDSHSIRSNTKTIIHRISKLTTRLNMFGIRSSSLSEQEESSSSNNNGGIIPLSRNYNRVVVNKEVVGLEEDIMLLVDHLVDDEGCRVVGLFGMGGLGKTTLAQKIFNHSMIKRHFACLAFVNISHKWQKNDLLKQIYFKFFPNMEWFEVYISEVELVEKILEIQNTKRCLVVLDDIWSNDAWDDLKAAFPVENIMRSKILLTTRNKDVAEYVAQSEGFLHQQQLLDENQSWELLKRKADIDISTAGSRYYHEMEVLGREMLTHCGGLPLGILVLGGILVTKPTLTSWERVYQSIRLSLQRGEGLGQQHQSEVFVVLESSYYDLPFQLKLCFLYFSQFDEDKVIEAERLYQLWIAEGFISSKDRREEETMLQVADCYLGELARRSMVQVEIEENESSIRKFKSCKLHDLMRDLSLNKAEEEDFFKALHYFQHGIMNQQLVVSSCSTDYYARRLVILEADDAAIESENVFLNKKVKGHLRSLMLDDVTTVDFVHMQGFLRSCHNALRLLRVLSLENMRFSPARRHHSRKLIMKAIGKLTNLRYLSLWGSCLESLSVSKLEYLETADLRLLHSSLYPSIKDTMLQKMGRLQHLYLPVGRVRLRGSSSKVRMDGLMRLETLVNFDPNWCETKDLFGLTNLQKLTIKVSMKVEDVEEIINYLSSTNSRSLQYSTLFIWNCNLSCGKGPSLIRQLFINGSRSFHQLEIGGNIGKLPVFNDQVSFLSSLTTLTIGYTTLEEDPMPTLEKIPNLRDLKVHNVSLEKKEMICSATGFSLLTRLTLHNIEKLEKWRVDEGAMPSLSYLEIHSCFKLTMLPNGLRFLTALQVLKLTGMLKEFRNRVEVVNGIEGDDLDKVRHVAFVTISV